MLDYPPHEFLSWQGRFDDPRASLDAVARFRTIYLARRRTTALRETLQDLRPDTRAIADFKSLFGAQPPRSIIEARWRSDRRIAKARIDIDEARVVDLENLEVRRALEEQHASLLAYHGMRHLDISHLRSRQRVVTQTIALELYATGKGAVLYRSTLDDELCVALFEGRARIRPYGPEQVIEDDDEDLHTVAAEWKLHIAPVRA